jgi:hypothetical protein
VQVFNYAVLARETERSFPHVTFDCSSITKGQGESAQIHVVGYIGYSIVTDTLYSVLVIADARLSAEFRINRRSFRLGEKCFSLE